MQDSLARDFILLSKCIFDFKISSFFNWYNVSYRYFEEKSEQNVREIKHVQNFPFLMPKHAIGCFLGENLFSKIILFHAYVLSCGYL